MVLVLGGLILVRESWQVVHAKWLFDCRCATSDPASQAKRGRERSELSARNDDCIPDVQWHVVCAAATQRRLAHQVIQRRTRHAGARAKRAKRAQQ